MPSKTFTPARLLRACFISGAFSTAAFISPVATGSVVSTGDVSPPITANDNAWSFTAGVSVGIDAAGSISVTDSGAVTSTGQVLVGDNASSSGQITVRGPGSRWDSTGPVYAGRWGQGHLEIEEGGVLATQSLVLGAGQLAGAAGSATVTGAGSLLHVLEDPLRLASRADGALTVSSGGVAKTDNWLSFGYPGYTATVTIGIGDDGTGNLASGRVVGDHLRLIGSSNLLAIELEEDVTEGSLAVGEIFTLIDYQTWDGNLFRYEDDNGRWHVLEDGGTFDAGDASFRIEYAGVLDATANDYAITATVLGGPATHAPEPALSLLGLSLIGMRRRRSRGA